MKKVGGVSYYFRAFIYYRLVSHYGNVPILRKRSKEVVPISPEAEVWTFIEEDLVKLSAYRQKQIPNGTYLLTQQMHLLHV